MATQIGYTYQEFSQDVLLGTTGSAVSLSAGFGALRGTHALMETWGLPLQEDPTYFSYFGAFSKIADPLLRTVLKTLAVVYITILIPIIESWFFHNMLYSWQETKSDGLFVRSYRVLTNALIFGAFHYSLFAGWANIPILVVSTIAGIVFAALREITGNVRATTIAHMLNNTIVMLTI